MAPLGPVCSCLVPLGPAWSRLAPLGSAWPAWSFNSGGPMKFEDTFFPNHHPLSENPSRTPLVRKNRALLLSRFNRGGPMKFEDTFFQIIILCRKITPEPNIWLTSDKSADSSLSIVVQFFDLRQSYPFFTKLSLNEFKPRGLIFWILAIYIHILTPVKFLKFTLTLGVTLLDF